MEILLSLEKVARSHVQSPKIYNPRDIILASYPKSGNTWLRFILSNVTRILSNSPVEVDFHTINYFSPHIGAANNDVCGYQGFPNSDRFLKTHFYYINSFKKYRTLLLIRNPKDVLVSFYDYQKYEIGRSIGDISDFVRHWRFGVKGWNFFYRTWAGKYTSLILYEELISAPVDIVYNALQGLGVAIDISLVKEAVDLSGREKMRALLDERGDPFLRNAKYEFVRKNERVERSSALSEQDIRMIKQKAGDTACLYGYSL